MTPLHNMFRCASPAIIAAVLYDRESIKHNMYSKDEDEFSNERKILDGVRNKSWDNPSNIDIFLFQYDPSVRFTSKLKIVIPSGILASPFYGVSMVSGFFAVSSGIHCFNPTFGIPATAVCAFYLGLGAFGIWAGNRIFIIVGDWISNRFDKTNLVISPVDYMSLSEIRRRNRDA